MLTFPCYNIFRGGPLSIRSWYPNFNESHRLPCPPPPPILSTKWLSSVAEFVWTMTYSHRPHSFISKFYLFNVQTFPWTISFEIYHLQNFSTFIHDTHVFVCRFEDKSWLLWRQRGGFTQHRQAGCEIAAVRKSILSTSVVLAIQVSGRQNREDLPWVRKEN